MKTLVVARYGEDVSWVDSISGYNVFVYDKSDGDIPPHHIRLPNIGRESHTFLTHIFSNYDDLTEWTLFAQGHPFDHCRHFLNSIQKPMFQEWGFAGFGREWNFEIESFDHKDRCVRSRVCCMVWPLIGEGRTPRRWPCHWGAQMLIHRELIWSKPPTFYKLLLDWHHNEYLYMPWGLEVCWRTIFRSNFRYLL